MIYGHASVDTRPELDAQAKARRAAGAEKPPKFTRHQREEALAAFAKGSATQADLARRFNVSRSRISRLCVPS
jgi:hypothetical protein